MKPGKLNLPLYPGRTFRCRFQVTDNAGVPVDLTGCSAAMQAKRKGGGSALLDASTVNGAITVDNTGHITVVVNQALTVGFKPGEALMYDLAVTYANGEQYSLLEGDLTVMPTVVP